MVHKVVRFYRFVLFFLAIARAACQGDVPAVGPAFDSDLNAQAPLAQRSTRTEPAPATPTITLLPTLTWTPPATQIPTITPTPTRTLHPMDVRAQRQTPYPGSEITITETLEPGPNYHRYIAYYLSEGLKIYGLLTVPYGDPPVEGWPGIVFNHGYIPPDVYRTTERYVAYVDLLARSGYVVYRIDYRGHDRSEGEAGGAYSNPGYTMDVMNAVAALQEFPLVDAQHIGMWGHSMGGYLTLRAMVLSNQVKTGVIWAGVVGSYNDLIYNWRRDRPSPPDPLSTPRWRTRFREAFGSPEDNPEFWNGISSTSYLADISGPVQLHHGDADTDVPLAFSQSLYDLLTEAGKAVELYTYPGDNHNISIHFNLAMARTIDFFDRYLKPVP